MEFVEQNVVITANDVQESLDSIGYDTFDKIKDMLRKYPEIAVNKVLKTNDNELYIIEIREVPVNDKARWRLKLKPILANNMNDSKYVLATAQEILDCINNVKEADLNKLRMLGVNV